MSFLVHFAAALLFFWAVWTILGPLAERALARLVTWAVRP